MKTQNTINNDPNATTPATVPTQSAVPVKTAAQHIVEGSEFNQAEKYNDAITSYEEAVKLGGTDKNPVSQLYYWIGLNYLEPTKKIEYFQKALNANCTNPGQVNFYIGLNSKTLEEAIKYYKAAIIEGFTEPAVYRNLGNCYYNYNPRKNNEVVESYELANKAVVTNKSFALTESDTRMIQSRLIECNPLSGNEEEAVINEFQSQLFQSPHIVLAQTISDEGKSLTSSTKGNNKTKRINLLYYAAIPVALVLAVAVFAALFFIPPVAVAIAAIVGGSMLATGFIAAGAGIATGAVVGGAVAGAGRLAVTDFAKNQGLKVELEVTNPTAIATINKIEKLVDGKNHVSFGGLYN